MRYLRRTAFTAAWILVPCLALARREPLSLKHGIYMLQNVACQEPANAAMMCWDGVGLSGPHASKCVSHVLSQHGSRFSVRTTCAALGDGTPNPSGQADVETLSVNRLSNARIVIASEAKQPATYRWCSAK